MTEQGVILNVEIGIVKELHKQEQITEIQMKKAIEILKQAYIKEFHTNGIVKEYKYE